MHWTGFRETVAFAVLDGKIADFTGRDGEEAARLFKLSGRRRGSHADCIIAACAISAGASVATFNRADFGKHAAHGLELEPPE